jgi:hypothetical protein
MNEEIIAILREAVGGVMYLASHADNMAAELGRPCRNLNDNWSDWNSRAVAVLNRYEAEKLGGDKMNKLVIGNNQLSNISRIEEKWYGIDEESCEHGFTRSCSIDCSWDDVRARLTSDESKTTAFNPNSIVGEFDVMLNGNEVKMKIEEL